MNIPSIRLEIAKDDFHILEFIPYEQLTIADYLRITEPGPPGELDHERITRAFGVPRRFARIMRAHEVKQVMDHYLEWIAKAPKMWDEVKAITEAIDKWDNPDRQWTQEDAAAMFAERGMHRTSFEVDGRTFQVPQRVELTTVWGQWLSLTDAVSSHKGPDAAMYPPILAVMCMEEGETYPAQGKEEGDNDFEARFVAWLGARVEMFHRARMVDAMAVCAFFLSSSEQFSATMTASTSNCPSWMRHWSGQTARPSGSDGDNAPS